nr:CP43k-like protein 2 [Megabalanus ajax]
MHPWVVVLAATLGVATAAPCVTCVVKDVISGSLPRPVPVRQTHSADGVVVVGAPGHAQQSDIVRVEKRGVGTKTRADVRGSIISIGNAQAVISGGARAAEQMADQNAGADVRLKLDAQRNGLGAGKAAAVGRSDMSPAGLAGSSQGDAITETRSTGEVSTEADAVGGGATLSGGVRSDAHGDSSSATYGDGTAAGITQTVGTGGQQPGHATDAGTGSVSQVESSGSGGSKSAGRGRGVAIGSDTTSASGSQTKVDVMGDGKAQAFERGTARGELAAGGPVRCGSTQVGSEGDVKTLGDGASGAGETTVKSTADQNGTTSSDSVARNQLKASRDGVAKAEVFTTGMSALGLDEFSKDLVVDTKSTTRGSQTTAGSAAAAANGGSTSGSTLVGAGTVSDTTFTGKTSQAGHIKAQLTARGQGRVTDGEPVVVAQNTANPDEDEPEPPVPVEHPVPYVPPQPSPEPYVPPYVPPQPSPAPYVLPFVRSRPNPALHVPPYVRPQPNPAPYVPPYVRPQPSHGPPSEQYNQPYHRSGAYKKPHYVTY